MPQLTANDIGVKIRDALRDSSGIATLCNTLFGKDHTVHYGSTGREAPAESEFPCYTVIPRGKSRSETADRRSFLFSVLLTILEDTIVTGHSNSDGSGIKTITYSGPESLEDLLDLALTAIKSISSQLFWEELDFTFETVEYYPLFVGELMLTISFPVTFDGDEPALT